LICLDKRQQAYFIPFQKGPRMIRKDFKSILFFYVQIITVWVIGWSLFFFIRQFGIDEFLYVDFNREPNRVLQLSIHMGLGLVTGILYASLEIVFERDYFQKRSYGHLMITKMITYQIMAFILMASAVMTYNLCMYGTIHWDRLGKWLVSYTFLAGLMHFFLISFLISFVRQINYKFGPGILWNMLKGKYHHPREEERIFMFLDLKGSTTIAEKLGHLRFSRFIQDCFFDLTDMILLHNCDIYQYVGDEVILSWPLKGSDENNSCIAFYFDFVEKLEGRRDYYQKKYNIQPFFKAGIHFGKVAVAEVGVIKREISYYGDVLNTAARIQGRCNEFDQGLLVSKDLKDIISFRERYKAKEMGVQLLRGKETEVTIFGIEKIYELG